MDRSEVTELHYITHLDNLPSIVELGVLSHERAEKVPHISVAMEEVQGTRADVRVPNGLKLHQYANFYFNARNTMLYKRKADRDDLGILSIRAAALDIADVVLTDCNAAAVGWTEFGACSEMLPKLDYNEINAESWLHADYYEYRRHKARMCAEVLVPHLLPSTYLRGVWVASEATKLRGEALNLGLKFRVNEYLFFRGARS